MTQNSHAVNAHTPAAPPPRPRSFVPRHNSTTSPELDAMVAETGFASMDALIDATVPASIRRKDGMDLGKYTDGMGEAEFLDFFK
jgi:glycine dehydrogenase